MKVYDIKRELRRYSSREKATFFPKFFKTANGQYAEGDKFAGITVPNCRLVASKFKACDTKTLQKLIESPIHEERLTALLILTGQFKKADNISREKIYNFYLNNTPYINNWDLVDLSASKIIGEFLLKNSDYITVRKGAAFKGTNILLHLSKSSVLWERRIAIIASHAFIKHGEFYLTLKISKTLINDKHDLIHKAVGWMLREVGKRSEKLLINFLKENYEKLPRTTLRYAIEIFSKNKKGKYLSGNF